ANHATARQAHFGLKRGGACDVGPLVRLHRHAAVDTRALAAGAEAIRQGVEAAVIGACLDQADGPIGVFGEARGEDGAGAAGPDDQCVKAVSVSQTWPRYRIPLPVRARRSSSSSLEWWTKSRTRPGPGVNDSSID